MHRHNPDRKHSRHRDKHKPLLTFGKPIPPRPITSKPTTLPEKETSEDELDAMEMSQVTCYNCQQKGHFASDCSKPKKHSYPNKRAKFKGKAKALYHTA